jgi:hypothetical protein
MENKKEYKNDEKKCECHFCEKTQEDCIHWGAYRRMPEKVGGLGLCPKLKIKK